MAAGCEAAPSTLSQRRFHFYDALRELALKVEVPPLYCRCQIWYHSLLSPIIKEVATPWHLKPRCGGGEEEEGREAWGLPGMRKSLRRLSLLARHNTRIHEHVDVKTKSLSKQGCLCAWMFVCAVYIDTSTDANTSDVNQSVSFQASVMKLIIDIQAPRTWTVFKVLNKGTSSE